jgi:translation initiation factor IF-2
MRVYELAKELGVPSKELLGVLKKGGFVATNHMAVLTDQARTYVEKHFAPVGPVKTPAARSVAAINTKDKKEETVVVHEPEPLREEILESAPIVDANMSLEDLEAQELREQERVRRLLHATGLVNLGVGQVQGPRRRRRRRPRQLAQPVQEERRGPVTEVTVSSNKALFEVADSFNKSSGDLILALLKKGIVSNRNNILSIDTIRELGGLFGITVRVENPNIQEQKTDTKKDGASARGQSRWPVVVVMGHVDHGKTTLLDYIRKMKVAATEKGGITQHIRAWEVDSAHGKVVFLDTPGHEAFSFLRERGSRVTDIVVLVVAVDDGIMPQTLEAIEHAKSSGVPIIVALNKIDKTHSPSAIETVKRQLAQHNLLPEEWGGETVVVPLSAKTGQGVEELLEMIVLHAQMMDLKVDTNAPTRGFVIESHIEKGFGPVATVICKEGILKQGDFFVCGSATGKIRILVNSVGQRVVQALPSTPVQIVGFDTFNGMGDWLKVVSQQEYTKAKYHKEGEQSASSFAVQPIDKFVAANESKSINLIIKTDTRGSKEAIMGSLDKVIKQNKDIKCPIHVVLSAIGDISESDIDLAADTHSIILGLHVRAERNAQGLAKEHGVDVQTFYIIYELIDYLQKLLESKKEVVMTWKKVGEAVVKKVFDIKGVGIIAGCYMRDGVLARGNKVACVRSGKQLGEGIVGTLQRERKSVKEIHAGFECGFTTDGFSEWQEGDTVVCYAKVKAE